MMNTVALPNDAPAMAKATQELRMALDGLGANLRVLNDRIRPVLSEAVLAKLCGVEAAEAGPARPATSSPLVEWMKEQAAVVRELTDLARVMVEACEL